MTDLERLVIKWSRTGMLDNISEDKKEEASNILENTVKKILNRETGSVTHGNINSKLLLDSIKHLI